MHKLPCSQRFARTQDHWVRLFLLVPHASQVMKNDQDLALPKMLPKSMPFIRHRRMRTLMVHGAL